MAMIPREQKLVERYKSRPFVLLGVCTDESLDDAQKTAAEHKMDWACWFDGQNAPIAHDWNILGWPTVYVLVMSRPIRRIAPTRPKLTTSDGAPDFGLEGVFS
jgi:hypothetical protein